MLAVLTFWQLRVLQNRIHHILIAFIKVTIMTINTVVTTFVSTLLAHRVSTTITYIRCILWVVAWRSCCIFFLFIFSIINIFYVRVLIVILPMMAMGVNIFKYILLPTFITVLLDDCWYKFFVGAIVYHPLYWCLCLIVSLRFPIVNKEFLWYQR